MLLFHASHTESQLFSVCFDLGESDSNEADEEIEEAYSDEDESTLKIDEIQLETTNKFNVENCAICNNFIDGDEDGIKDKLPLPPYTENDKLNDDSNDRLANNESPLSADMKKLVRHRLRKCIQTIKLFILTQRA